MGSIRFSAHLRTRIVERGLETSWVEDAVIAPDWIEFSPEPALTRAFEVVPQHGGKVLRVVYRPDGSDILVVTAHFDRGARRG